MNPILKLVAIAVAFITLVGVIIFSVLATNEEPQSVGTNTAPVRPGSEFTIIAFGDSLTAGLGLPVSESYPAQLELALNTAGYPVTVINSGVSGETTRGNLERAEFIRKQNPDVVLLGIGGNDALRALDLTETRKNIEATVTTLKAGENPPVVVLLQMQAPLNGGLSYKREFDALYEEIADAHDLVLVPFITAEVFLKAGNKLPDGIHLNAIGYKQVIDLYLLEAVKEVLDGLR